MYGFRLNVACCWDMLAWWISYSLYVVQSVFKGDSPTYMIFIKHISMVACVQTFTERFLLNLVWWLTSLNYVVWYHCEHPWPLFKVTVIWKSRKFCVHFLANFCQCGLNLLFCPDLLVWIKYANSFCCKVAWSSPNICSGLLCEGDDCKEVLLL